MAYSVLIVDQHPTTLARWIEPLRDAGYDVSAAASFTEARQRLAVRTPHLLIAASRLGGFHGLHLVMRGYYDHPSMTAIVTMPADDPVLTAEATVFGASCIVAPGSRAERLAVVSRAFSSRPM